jgi:hypothetical protein
MMAPILSRNDQDLALWDDSLIRPGVMWRDEMEKALAQARVALLLVSANFLASEFVMRVEVPALLRAAKDEGVPILWVSLSPCLWEKTPISEYQALLPPDQHLAGLDGIELAKVLKAISLKIEKAMTCEEWSRKPGANDAVWEAILASIGLPATRVLLRKEAKLLSIDSRRAVIGVTGAWMAMLQSRLPLIEEAVCKAVPVEPGCGPRAVMLEQHNLSPTFHGWLAALWVDFRAA